MKDTADNEQAIALSAYGAGVVEPYSRAGPTIEQEALGGILDCTCHPEGGSGVFAVCCNPDGCNPQLSFRGWQAEFETVRVRLTDFLNNGSGVDLSNLAAVRLEFGGAGSGQGRIAIDDVEFTSDALTHPPPPPCPIVNACPAHNNCLQGSPISSVDTGLNACQPQTGDPLYCSTQTVHVVTYTCDKAPCCFDQLPCSCPPGNCPDGTYLECQ